MALEQVLAHSAADTPKIDEWFDRVFDETKDQILRYICIHVDNLSNADDVFQEVYTNLYKRIQRKGMKDIAEPAAFLTQAAKREIVRFNRRNKGSRAVSVEESAAFLPCGGLALEDTIADRDKLRMVQETVRAMPLLTSKVFVLFYYFDMPIASIAEELGISVDAAKSRLNRARREVRTRLSWED